MQIRRRAVTATLAAALVLAGCGGGDDDAGDDAPVASDAGAPATAAPSGGGGGGGGLGMGPETFAKQLLVALRADSYTVDGTAITMEFTEGTTADAESKCTIALATVGTNATVTLAFPDGDVLCE